MGHEMNGLPYAVAVWASCGGRHELHPAAWNRLGAVKPEDMLCPYISSSRCATTTPATAIGSSWAPKSGGGGAQPLPHCLHAPQRRVFAFETFRDVRRLARVWRHLTVRAVCELQVPFRASATTASHKQIILYPEIQVWLFSTQKVKFLCHYKDEAASLFVDIDRGLYLLDATAKVIHTDICVHRHMCTIIY